jgi:hypothetical protein
MVRRRASGLFLMAFVTAVAAIPQERMSRYEMQYGEPVDVSISDLVSNPSSYENRSVRTHGQLELEATGSFRTYAIRSNFGERVRVAPVPDVSAAWDSEVLNMVGRDLDVTGVFLRATSQQLATAGSSGVGTIQFWKFLGEPPEIKDAAKVPVATIEQLTTNPARFEGRQLKVIGQFRGRNLFGDLPPSTQTNRADWVVKDDVYALWITGRKPKGEGFELDPGLKRDTGKWLEVVGRVDVRRGFAYLTAQRVALSLPPTPTAHVEPPKPPPERPKLPPMVIFALPLDGESDVPGGARFAVQFSKDMEEDSFKGRVVLRYAGRPQPGDRDLDGVVMRYDGGRRALVIDPGDVLRPGRQVELLLLPGIVDTDAMPLAPRHGPLPEGANVVDALHWRIGL